jgi:hypothetical protein
MASSSWPILFGIVALCAGAFWYDAHNEAVGTTAEAPPSATLVSAR